MKPTRFRLLLLTTVFLLAASCGSPPEDSPPQSAGGPEESQAAAAGTRAAETTMEKTTVAPEKTAEKPVKKNAPGEGATKEEPKEKPKEKVVEVEIRSLKYLPGPLTVSPGTMVRWVNEDVALHTVTSEDSGGPLQSEELEKGESYEYTFREPGQYNYYCTVHPFMKSGVTVE